MTVTRKEIKDRRASFSSLVKSLGLPPVPTSPNAQSFAAKVVDGNNNPIIKATQHKQDESGVINKWLVSPVVIESGASPEETTSSSIIVDFIETAQIADDLSQQIHNFAKSPDEARKIAVIVGKSPDNHANAKTCEEKFSTLYVPDALKSIYADAAQAEANSKLRNNPKLRQASNKARQAVLDTLKQSDAHHINEPDKLGSKGNWSNCAVHTIFVHATTSKEGLGGSDTSLFLNYMPNHIISRAVPILNVTIDLPDGIEKRKLIQALGPSLLLGESIGLKGASAELDGAFTKTIDPNTGKAQAAGRSIGNDTFNLPQTLGPSRRKVGSLLNDIDPSPTNQFAPIAVIQDFSFNFDGGALSSLMTREAAKGELTLMFPDKTKLTGLDQLLIGTNDLLTMTIEFGWSILPNQTAIDDDGTKTFLGSKDPMVKYVNSQKLRLGCRTTLSNMEFTDAGAARLTMGLTDPANYDTLEGPGIGDVADFIKVYNKTDPRFVRFVTSVLQKGAAKASGAGDISIATETGYRKRITKIFGQSKKSSLSKKQRKQIGKYNKKRLDIHYKVDDLVDINSGNWKDGDLIIDHINTIKNTSIEEIEGYDYYVISLKAGGSFPDIVKAYVDEVKQFSDKPKKKYSKNTPKRIAYLKKALAEEFLYFTVPAGREVPDTQSYKRFRAVWDALVKEHEKRNKRIKNKPPQLKAYEAFKKDNDSGIKQLESLARGEFKLKVHIKPGKEYSKIPIDSNTGDLVGTALANIGKVKLDYPKTLIPPMTASQQKKRKKSQSSMDSLATLKGSDLKEARDELMFWAYNFILSNGFVVQTNAAPKSSQRIVDKLVGGKDVSSEALKVEANDKLGGKLMTWWYESAAASNFLTFSHLVHHGLVQPLYATGVYDEIQVLYFKFNNQCGRMSGMNIGDTPITQTKSTAFDKYSNPFDFINHIISTQINEVLKNKTPYGFDTRKVKSKSGKKTITEIMPNQIVPHVEYCTRVITAQSGDPTQKRKILRISFVDHFSSADEGAGQRIMNSMREDGRTTAISPIQTVNQKSTEAIRKKIFIKALEEAKIIKDSETLDGSRDILTGPRTFRIIKAAIKASHPHLNYGTTGTSLLRASISGKMGGSEQMLVFNKAMTQKKATSSSGRFGAAMAGKPTDIAITEVTGMSRSVTIDMIGCPMLQVGSLYFIDFYTETDVDNFYICKKVSHKITNNQFTTSGEFHVWDSGGRHTIPGDVDGIARMKAESEP